MMSIEILTAKAAVKSFHSEDGVCQGLKMKCEEDKK
jgi:hypothetical protein